MRKQKHFAGCAGFSLRLHWLAKGIPARMGPRSERKGQKEEEGDHTHREELEEALQPLERVDSHPHLSSGLRPCLEPQLEARCGSRRVVHRQPRDLPPPEDDSSWATRCVLGEQLWTAKRRRDFPMALNAASAVFYAGALLAAYKRRLWPLMFFGGTSYLLKLWFLDRMTLYYEQQREREEPPKEEAEAATTPSSA